MKVKTQKRIYTVPNKDLDINLNAENVHFFEIVVQGGRKFEKNKLKTRTWKCKNQIFIGMTIIV